MNIERFHNELAIRLGYERIVNEKRILISVEESEDPLVTLRIDGYDDIKLKATDKLVDMDTRMTPDILEEIKHICDAVHEAYVKSANDTFACYTNS